MSNCSSITIEKARLLQELGLSWDKEADESLLEKAAEYCVNDVEAIEALFNAFWADFIEFENSHPDENDPWWNEEHTDSEN